MFRIGIALMGLMLWCFAINAQETPLDAVLQSIEANNPDLMAFRSYQESEALKYKTSNNLPDPEASAYYLPLGIHDSPDYTEFEIGQRFEFPTVYAARSRWIHEQKNRLDYQYQARRQEILQEAKTLFLELVYLQKKREIAEQRLTREKKVFEQIQILYDKNEISILSFNKAKVVWLDQQFAKEELEAEWDRIMKKLEALNGGEEVVLEPADYPNALQVQSLESLWTEKLSRDPELQVLEMDKAVAAQRIKVEKNQLLPEFTAGYNYQGVPGNNYSGIYAGVSIPLWNGRNKVNTARAQLNYFDQRKQAILNSQKAAFTNQYNHFELLQSKLSDYQEAMEGLNSEQLLQRSFELGEISYREYYLELKFYREAEDRLLQMEQTLHKLQSALLKHQL